VGLSFQDTMPPGAAVQAYRHRARGKRAGERDQSRDDRAPLHLLLLVALIFDPGSVGNALGTPPSGTRQYLGKVVSKLILVFQVKDGPTFVFVTDGSVTDLSMLKPSN
jgi:hypothetical protein